MKKRYKSISIILMGILFIGIGIYQNDYQDNLMKAIYICLECIGIG